MARLYPPALTAIAADRPLTCLTAHNYPMARALDDYVDVLLVGDSLAMVNYGLDSTLPLSLETMALHGAAVVRGSSKCCVVVDMPFASYQQSPAQAFESAAYLLQQTGAQAVKLEGGAPMVETVRFLVERGVPVMAHIGLTPQSVNQLGGFKRQGTTDKTADILSRDAADLAEAGAFALVLEAVPAKLAASITRKLPIPTIGIGAGSGTSGQILVTEDILGLTENAPPFAKKLVDLNAEIQLAAGQFRRDVQANNPLTTTREIVRIDR